MLSVCELFASYQGEGLLTGVPSIFVRVAGCHLRCGFCDTAYAWRYSGGRVSSVEEILRDVCELAREPTFPEVLACSQDAPTPVSRVRHVVLTGGEPMLFRSAIPLCRGLREAGFHVTVETSGSRFLPLECDLMSVSPKLENSGNPEPLRSVAGTLRDVLACGREFQLKFVVDQPGDRDGIGRLLAEFPELPRDRVLLMPQGRTAAEVRARAAWVADLAAELGVGTSPRAHLEWFDPLRGPGH